jgi:hypothetical protein
MEISWKEKEKMVTAPDQICVFFDVLTCWIRMTMLSFFKNLVMQNEIIKTEIKKSYADIAKGDNSEGCCSNKACCTGGSFAAMTGGYNQIEGYQKEADLSLGCGIPTSDR